jgi:hypothetical protein
MDGQKQAVPARSSEWLEREELQPEELTSDRVDGFLAARRAAGYSTWLSARSTALPLG